MKVFDLHSIYGRRFELAGPEANRMKRVVLPRQEGRRIKQFLNEQPRQGLLIDCPPGSVGRAKLCGSLLDSKLTTVRPMISLRQRLVDVIQQHGPISFKEYMRFIHTAEPGPDMIGGYYTEGRVRFGRGRHFITHPEKHSPYYGAAFARFARMLWQEMGQPGRFEWVEMGAGNGLLCRDVMDTVSREAPAEFRRAFAYKIVEVSPALIELQKQTINGHPVEWINSAAQYTSLGVEVGVFFSNELFDDIPVNKIIVRGRDISEVFVDVDQNDAKRFVEVERPPTDPAFEEYLSQGQGEAVQGYPIYVSLEAARLMRGIGNRLGSGLVTTVDYGYRHEDMNGGKYNLLAVFGGRKRTGKRHIGPAERNPYAVAGELNLTTNVPFAALEHWGEKAGLQTVAYLPEMPFLVGFDHYFFGPLTERENGSSSNFKVLIQQKNVRASIDLTGLLFNT